MDWLPGAVSAGGPWAITGTIIITVVGMVLRGDLVPGKHVDRVTRAYEQIIATERDDKTAWKAAHAVELERGRVLTEQNGKLLEHSSLSAHAWAGIREAAERAGTDAA